MLQELQRARRNSVVTGVAQLCGIKPSEELLQQLVDALIQCEQELDKASQMLEADVLEEESVNVAKEILEKQKEAGSDNNDVAAQQIEEEMKVWQNMWRFRVKELQEASMLIQDLLSSLGLSPLQILKDYEQLGGRRDFCISVQFIFDTTHNTTHDNTTQYTTMTHHKTQHNRKAGMGSFTQERRMYRLSEVRSQKKIRKPLKLACPLQ
jgi:hypothetical protein